MWFRERDVAVAAGVLEHYVSDTEEGEQLRGEVGDTFTLSVVREVLGRLRAAPAADGLAECASCGGSGRVCKPRQLAKRLRYEREQRALGQAEAARQMGVPEATLHRMEAATGNTQWRYVAAALKFYNVELSEIDV